MLVGKVRAKQYYSDDHDRSRNMGVLLHGDGSFSGQGVVYETLDMSALQDYTVGGVIHIVVNNQVSCSCPSASAMYSDDLLTGRRMSVQRWSCPLFTLKAVFCADGCCAYGQPCDRSAWPLASCRASCLSCCP